MKHIPPETCDDGNFVSGDGCSNICQVEFGWSCNATSGMSKCNVKCGDKLTVSPE